MNRQILILCVPLAVCSIVTFTVNQATCNTARVLQDGIRTIEKEMEQLQSETALDDILSEIAEMSSNAKLSAATHSQDRGRTDSMLSVKQEVSSVRHSLKTLNSRIRGQRKALEPFIDEMSLNENRMLFNYI
eukprot:TRINITY_DN2039_c0_g1_i4.p1 TRINITY_DN2039_c0_g1~~TRINITY_DN2039_c0_g1_i4.p1  ORF type:complete len:132 (+),score=11.67 TRINITY_DN2039_c0_g1_i4:47-442(+)